MPSRRPPGTQPSTWSRGAGGMAATRSDLVGSKASPNHATVRDLMILWGVNDSAIWTRMSVFVGRQRFCGLASEVIICYPSTIFAFRSGP